MLIIFDVDGTLVDSQNLIYAAQCATFEAHGLPVPSREKVLSEMARSAGMRALGVDWGYHPVESLRGAGASRIISAMQDLLNLQDLLALRA